MNKKFEAVHAEINSTSQKRKESKSRNLNLVRYQIFIQSSESTTLRLLFQSWQETVITNYSRIGVVVILN